MAHDQAVEQGAAADDDASERLLRMINGSWVTQALYVAAELRLPDLLSAGPRTGDELAREADVHPPALRRLLRALATLEIVHERPGGAFELTPLGERLRDDHPESLRGWARLVGGKQWPVWGNLLYSVRTGRSARAMLTGVEGFGHLDRDPEWAAVFHRAMVDLSRLVAPAVVRAYDFGRFGTIVDVGGGHGELLARILAAHPAARGVLFDLSHAMADAKARMEQAGVSERCAFVAGSFFNGVPPGADAYVLKSIIHDWDDAQAGQILGRCREAMPAQATLLLVERVRSERPQAGAADQDVARSDLNMLVALAAQERTEAEFAELLRSSGFRQTRVIPAGRGHSVIEAFVS